MCMARIHHGSCLQKLYFMAAFFFRFLVLETIGAGVYSDERSKFQCQVKNRDGCESMCFDKFTTMHHPRFWKVQIVAVFASTALYHLYCRSVEYNYLKLQFEQQMARKDKLDDHGWENMLRRKKRLGRVRVKEITYNKKPYEIITTKKTEMAYSLTLAVRLIVEIVFIVLGFNIFNIKDGETDFSTGWFNFAWMEVPALYACRALGSENVRGACFHHMADENNQPTGMVPCWISRPAERTIFLRYMNIVILACVFINFLELGYSLYKVCKTCVRERNENVEKDEQVNLDEPEEVEDRRTANVERLVQGERNVLRRNNKYVSTPL